MSNPSYDTDVDYSLWWLIVHMRRAMYKARAKELFQYGITPEEAAVLFIVKAIGPRATPAEISRWLLREPHSTSGLINRMEKKGLIRKVKDLERKNMVRVAITEKGQQSHNQSAKRGTIHRIMSALDGDERQQMWEYVRKLRDKAFEETGVVRKPSFPPS